MKTFQAALAAIIGIAALAGAGYAVRCHPSLARGWKIGTIEVQVPLPHTDRCTNRFYTHYGPAH
jgi:hypothetical protein